MLRLHEKRGTNGENEEMAKRTRMTEMEAHAVKTRQSESVGSRGKGTLLLERKASGTILAYYRERTASSDNRLQLGTLSRKPVPDTQERTLSDLRAEALRISTAAEAGGGLVRYLEQQAEQVAAAEAERELRRREEERKARRGSFGDLLDGYVEHLEKGGKASTREVHNIFRSHVRDHHPELIARPAADIRPEDIQLILAGVLRRRPSRRGIGNKAVGSASNAMRTTTDKLRRYLRAAFSHAVKSHLSPERLAHGGKLFAISSNPARDIPVIEGTGGGDTESLEPAELAELLRYLDTLPERNQAVANALIYLGGQRLRQICAVRWGDVTEETISLLDPKGRKAQAWAHLLPITPRIREVMEPLLRDRIGPGPLALVPGRAVSDATLSKIFSEAGSALAASGKARPFTWKNVRVTAETLMAAQGVSAEVRAWLLSHGRSGVQQKHYDRYSYLPEKLAALEQWGRYLDRLKEGGITDNVVLLSKRRG